MANSSDRVVTVTFSDAGNFKISVSMLKKLTPVLQMMLEDVSKSEQIILLKLSKNAFKLIAFTHYAVEVMGIDAKPPMFLQPLLKSDNLHAALKFTM